MAQFKLRAYGRLLFKVEQTRRNLGAQLMEAINQVQEQKKPKEMVVCNTVG